MNFLIDTPKMTEEVMTGTTILAIKVKDAVVIGADTRTSTGRLVYCNYTNKLTQLSDTIYCLRSGSAADTRIIADYVSLNLKSQQYLYNTKPTVRMAAQYCQDIIYKYPQLLAGMIIAGYDTEPHVFNITLGGSCVEGDIALGGSGSLYIYGHCDQAYKSDMSVEEGVDFVQKCVGLAIKRDNFSGGCIRMAVISDKGVEKLFVPGNVIYK